MQRKISSTLIGVALLALCGTASAQWSVRGGLTHIAPHSTATDAVGPMLPGPPSGISIDVKNKATAFLSLAYGLNPNMELELALGYPPTHDVTARIAGNLPPHIAAFNGQKLAEVRQIAPTLFLNYKFGEASSAFRPFVGIGVNYTKFDKRESTALGNQLNGGPTDIRLTDSWGPSAQAGLSYRVNDKWALNVAVATARVKTHLTATTAGQARKIDIRFRPTVVTLSAGYVF